jgi:TonB family protein
METVAPAPPESRDELRFLTDWGARETTRRREAGVISILLHVAAIGALAMMPAGLFAPAEREIARAKQNVTPLIAPLEMTQPVPNRGPLSKEIHADQALPRPRIHIPPSPPSTTRPAARQLAPPRPQAVPGAPLPEPPKMEASARPGEALNLGIRDALPPPPPPQIQAQEKPKLAFETPGAESPGVPSGVGRLAKPNTSVEEAVRNVARGGSVGGMVVGDVGIGSGGIGEMLNMPPSPGRQASALELLSDPQGVDFRPYLIQILQNVRRNWFAVMPESAKLGRRGKVIIQFAISKMGAVPKLVIVTHSGTDALDRAAVAGISASNPFPPLPPEFRGDTVRLQFTFAYNMPR